MTDNWDKKTRSRVMASIQSKNTKLEVGVRRRLFSMGFRYRLHSKKLRGKPDLIFPKYQAIIFVHGCFWHYHGCQLSRIPKTRSTWWKQKLEGNKKRDWDVLHSLMEDGWRVLIIWECSVRHSGASRREALDLVASMAAKFLKSNDPFGEITYQSFFGVN